MSDARSETQDPRSNKMLTDPLPKVITTMAIPSIIAFFITSIYNLADTYFVSSLGDSATAAVSVNASLDQFIMTAGSLFAVGAASFTSRLLGADDKKKADQVLSTAFFLAALFGVVIMVLGIIFSSLSVLFWASEQVFNQWQDSTGAQDDMTVLWEAIGLLLGFRSLVRFW